MRDFASLQLLLDEQIEAARERIIYVVTAHMDAAGFIPCGRESAERTIAFARINGGWAVFDDSADRLDVRALDGLACCLTGKLRTRAVGVMGSREGMMLRLYHDGRLRDTFITSTRAPGKTSRREIACHKHAIRWRSLLRGSSGGTNGIRDLAAAFLRAKEDPSEGLHELQEILALDNSATYGFASIEDAHLEGVVTLYFHAANHVRQRWFDRFLRLPARCGSALVGVFFRRRCRQRR